MYHVVGFEVVLFDGEMIYVGGGVFDVFGFDLLGVLVGSEGMLVVVMKVMFKLF